MITTTLLSALIVTVLGYLAVCALLAQRFTLARRLHVQRAKAERVVRFPARDGRARIEAHFVPGEGGDGRAVVLVHGKDACRGHELKGDSTRLVAALSARGIAVLAIDLRGHGRSSRARLTYGERERFDVLGAVDWLREQGHDRIGVLGASMGAATALLAAADEPAIVALVADSPFADFGRMIERQYRRLSGLPLCFLPGGLVLARLLTGVNLRRVRPLQGAQALRGRPVLVIHSEGDRFVPADDGRAIAAACQAELWTTATAGHVGSYKGETEAYVERVLGFFGRHLAERA